MSESRLIDVATAAGVSLRTASRVLNDDHRVAGPTRARVHAAMEALAFEPDAVARSLRAGVDTAVGLVVESIADPFFAQVIDAVETRMATHRRSVLVASTHRDTGEENAAVRRMLQRRIAGLLVVPTRTDPAWLPQSSVPTVFVDRGDPAAGSEVDVVHVDDYQAAFDAVSHLAAHGHRSVAYVGDTSDVPTSAARLAGYKAAVAGLGLNSDPELVIDSAATSEQAAAATHRLLDAADGDTRVSAILSATTRASLGVVPVLHSRHRTDLALVGIGDFAMADALQPGITVIDHSGARLGEAAADRLIERMGDRHQPGRRITLPTPIITRGSGELSP